MFELPAVSIGDLSTAGGDITADSAKHTTLQNASRWDRISSIQTHSTNLHNVYVLYTCICQHMYHLLHLDA